MKRFVPIWSLFCFVSCFSVGKRADRKSSFDEVALLQFVKSSATQNQILTLQKLDSILANASGDSLVFQETVNCLAKIYSDPNSSFRNESFYDKMLKAQLDSKWYRASKRRDVVRKFHLLHQNDVRNLANNFEYLMPNGQRKTMHSIEVERLVLFFYNPECDACQQMKSALENSLPIAKAIAQEKLEILCIYTDNDLSAWYRHLQEYSSQWIQGRDENEYLYKRGIYDLKAIPTIYLLDRDKNVILKDCTSIEELEQNIK